MDLFSVMATFVLVFALALLYRCWSESRPVCKKWDALLRSLMKDHRFKKSDEDSDCTVTIGGVQVWVANHPYASFRPYPHPDVYPRKSTVRLAAKKLIEDMVFEKSGIVDKSS